MPEKLVQVALTALPVITIADLRVVFQTDQAASSYQSLFRHIRERSQDANLDCGLGLRAHRHRQKRLNLSASLYEMLQILSLTMFERMALNHLLNRKNTDGSIEASANQLNLVD